MKQMKQLNLTLYHCIIILFLMNINVVYSICLFIQDSLDCPCFINDGAWDPEGPTIQDVASGTLGTKESCSLANGGKPYYQMVLGCNSQLLAEFVADVMNFGINTYHPREAWCSETISYWHREAQLPYPGGYQNDTWCLNWQRYCVNAIISWYEVESSIADGRGRWLDWSDLDYEDGTLGVSIPVPGAYIAIWNMSYVNGDSIEWNSGNHSQIIDEMWIHYGPDNKIKKITVTLLEGNISYEDTEPDMVTDYEYEDLLSITPYGNEWIWDNNKTKIYGFGIDLDENQEPTYDPFKVHHVLSAVNKPYRKKMVATIVDPEGQARAKKNRELAIYAQKAEAHNGPEVKPVLIAPSENSDNSNIERLQEMLLRNVQGYPGAKMDWLIPVQLNQYDIEITIDLLDVYPLPIKGIIIEWGLTNSIPENYKVMFAGADEKYIDAIIPQIMIPDSLYDPKLSFPLPVQFGKSESGMNVRYVKLVFPANSLYDTAIIKELRFDYDYGPDTDIEYNPNLKGDVDGDGSIDIVDALFIAQYYVGLNPPGFNPDAADVNCDGKVDIVDALLIARYYVGLIPAFKECDPTPGPTTPPGLGKYLFEVVYENYAWGVRKEGMYIDSTGDIYNFTGGLPELDRPVTGETLTDRYALDRIKSGTVEPGILTSMANLIEPAFKGELSNEIFGGCDMGINRGVAYRFLPETGMYHGVLLFQEGDWIRFNYSPEARILSDWLHELTNFHPFFPY